MLPTSPKHIILNYKFYNKTIINTVIILILLSAILVWSLKLQIHQKYLANATANAIKNKNEPEALMFLKEGIDPNYKDSHGNTLIMLAIFAKEFSVADYLFIHGASLNTKNLSQ